MLLTNTYLYCIVIAMILIYDKDIHVVSLYFFPTKLISDTFMILNNFTLTSYTQMQVVDIK